MTKRNDCMKVLDEARESLHSLNYPAGFERAGGLRLPLKERRDALLEVAERTRDSDITQTIQIVTRIVKEKWESLAKQPSDITQLTYGKATVTPFHDPDAHNKAIDMLVRIPTIPCFASVLDAGETKVWSMWFRDRKPQAEIGAAVGKAQSTVAKIIGRAIQKMNAKYRELRNQDALPIEIVAWVRQAGLENAQDNPDLAAAITALRKRDQALRAGRLKDADTGCNDLNKFALRAA